MKNLIILLTMLSTLIFCFQNLKANQNNFYLLETQSLQSNITSIFPNPVNLKGTINFSLQAKSDVNIEFFDISGKIVKRILLRGLSPGTQQIIFDSTDMKDGVYFCKISTNEWVEAKRIVIRR